MSLPDHSFTTGPATLPDVGELTYNGCTFSPLFETQLSGEPIKDEARRTVKYTKIVLSVDGFVTLEVPPQAFVVGRNTTIAATMATLHALLTTQGGKLTYRGRGFDLLVNTAAGGYDVAWGPVPELIEFQPLGGGVSAKVKWKVEIHVTSQPLATHPSGAQSLLLRPLLQFNFETAVTYNEDGFSSLSVRGILEIPMTRDPVQTIRTIPTTADHFRFVLERRILQGVDLSRFRVVRREFRTSRDKRILEWDFEMEEKPYMDLPSGCTIARGTYTCRPSRTGPGLIKWNSSLRATYTVRKDAPRRVAWVAFLALMRLRMIQSQLGQIPPLVGPPAAQNPPAPPPGPAPGVGPGPGVGLNPFNLVFHAGQGIGAAVFRPRPAAPLRPSHAILIDFGFDEGLYLDSKTVTFHATWWFTCPWPHILNASGLWKKLDETFQNGNNLWAMSMRDIQGTQSWLRNRLDPALDIIVDFGLPGGA